MTLSSPAADSAKDNSKPGLAEKILFGNQPSPELAAILVVYFVQGILNLARLAVSFFLKDDLGLSPAQVSALMGFVVLPWMLKPLYGFISDGLPIFGYRRRPYLILSGLLGAGAWVALATVIHSAIGAAVAIALSSLSIAVADVIADSLVVERVRQESQAAAGSLQALCFGTSALGGVVTAYFSGFLLEHISTRGVFAITASFPLIVSLVAGLIAEDRISTRFNWGVVQTQVQQLRQAIAQRVIWMPTLFIFIWQATPTSESAFFFFSTNELGFPPEFLGRLRLVSSLAALVGAWLFHRFFRAVPFRKIFSWTIVISTVVGLSSLLLVTHANRALGIGDRWFSLGDSLVITVMGEIAYLPVLVLAARICPPGIEATLFALLMSVFNLSGLLANEIGAGLTYLLGVTETNFDRLWLLVLITNLSNLIPLPFVGLLPRQGDRPDAAADLEWSTDASETAVAQGDGAAIPEEVRS